MASRADPGVGARLVGMTSGEAGTMKTRQAHVAEGQLPGQRGDRALTVTRRALAVGVAARAEVPRARRTNAVLADEVTVVNEVVVRRHALVAEIDVATAAVTHRPLLAMLVTPEAGRHRRQDRPRTTLGHLGVAADAVAADRDHVARMLEAKLRARELGRLPYVGLAVAVDARMIVVRFLVAAAADRVGGEVQRSSLPRRRHVRVALDAVDALERVRAVLERVRWRITAQAEHAGAGGKRDGQEHDERETGPHRAPGYWPPAVGFGDGPPRA